jgi:predicted dehydrogenase
MSVTAELRVGVVGAGFMGGTHAAAWVAQGVPVTLYGEDQAQVDEVAARLGAPVAASLDELLAAVDIIDVCTPTDAHAEICVAAAAAGRHVVCEKPLARTVEDAERIVAACDAAGVRLFVGHVLRYFPEYAAAQALVASGRIGDPAVLRLKRAAFRPRKPADHWLFDERRSGGMVFDLLIHDMDFARWIAGDVVSVHCRTAAVERPGLGVDHAFVILSHASGAITQLTGSWAYGAPTFRTSMEIAGSRGLVEVDSERSQPILSFLHARADSGQGAVGLARSLSREDPFAEQLRDFLAAIVGGGEARVTARDGLAAVRIGVAAIESARSGRPVTIWSGSR